MDVRQVRGMEEFIAVVFGNEVWMGLVDFKSDKPPEEAAMEEEFGSVNGLLSLLQFVIWKDHQLWSSQGLSELLRCLYHQE
jgi:hypothetical protein